MNKIFHLALVADWEKAVAENRTYFPPTYDQDGFTHGTGEANRLLEVANHFYTESVGDWVCLEMTENQLNESGAMVRYEPAAAVGDKSGELANGDTSAPLFPHIYGGIHPSVVIGAHSVERDASGGFVKIEISDVP